MSIRKDITIKVKKEDVKLKQEPYVFRGDKGIIFSLSIENWNYYFSDEPSAKVDQFTGCTAKIEIIKPDASLAKIIDVPIVNNAVQFKVNENLSEMTGDYRVFVEILKDNTVIATVPPFTYKVLEKPDFSDTLPVNIGFLTSGAENEPLLAYNSLTDYGIKTIAQLPKIKTYKNADEIVIQSDGVTKTITVENFISSNDAKIEELVNASVSNATSSLDSKITQQDTEHKQLIETKLTEGKGYTDQKIRDLVGLAPPELDTLKEIGDFAKENKSLIDGFTATLEGKANKVHTHDKATASADGYMSKEDFAKLQGIATGANNYTHPKTHQASIIVQDSTHRFVTDAEKTTWTDTKIDHAAIEGNELVLKAKNVEKFRLPLPKTYTLPIASTETLGGIKLGVGLEVTEDGTVNVLGGKAESVEWSGILNKPNTFTPPIATKSVLGGIKVGEGLDITSDGTLSANVKQISWDGVQGKPSEFTPTKATSTTVGGIKPGTGLSVALDGTLNITQNQLTPEWNKISNKPTKFAPDTHTHNKSEITGLFSVENSLTSNSATNALSVQQGKVISDKVDSLQSTVDGLGNSTHGHTNKAELDKITTGKVESWDAKASASHKHTKSDITDLFAVENVLTSTSTSNALSAAQGKVLNDKIESSKHTHSNKVALDKVTDSKITAWDGKETTIGSQAKADKALEDAKAYADTKIQVRKAFTKVISTSDFGTISNGVYTATVTHNLGTNKILISFIDNASKESSLAAYKIVDNNTIQVSSTTNTALEVTIVDANLSAPTTGGGSGNPDYQKYRIEYNSVRDSLDFIYTP